MPAGASDAVRRRDQFSHFSVGRARANLRPRNKCSRVRFVLKVGKRVPVPGFDRGPFSVSNGRWTSRRPVRDNGLRLLQIVIQYVKQEF